MATPLKITDVSHALSLYPQKVRGPAIGAAATVAELLKMGLIGPAGTVAARVCDRCDELHSAVVVSTPQGQGWYCPADGFINATPHDVAAYVANPECFIEMLAAEMDKRRRWAKPRDNPVVWSIGSYLFQELRVGVYFSIHAADLDAFNEVATWLKAEPACDGIALLTSDTRDVSQLILPPAGRIVSIADCVFASDDGGFRLDYQSLARRVLPDYLLKSAKIGRPNEKQQLAAGLIRELDRKGELRSLSGNERHRVLERAAKERHGEETTLSKTPCELAWRDYVSRIGGPDGAPEG